MSISITAYALLPLLSGLVLAGLAAYVLLRRSESSVALPFVALLATIAIWALFDGLEMLFGGLESKIIVNKLSYLGKSFVCPTAFLFSLHATGRGGWLNRRGIALLAAIPAATLVLNATNEWHHLFFTSMRIDHSDPFPRLAFEYGPWFALNLAYSYLLIALAAGMLLLKYLRAWGSYRGEAILVLSALGVPWLASILYFAGFGPIPHLDTTCFAFSVTGFTLSWSVLRYGMFDVIRVKQGGILDGMSDGVMVVDMRDRLVDLNLSATRILGLEGLRASGQPIRSALASHPDLVELFRGAIEGRSELELDNHQGHCSYDLQISPILGPKGGFTHRVLVLRDITDRKQAEEDLRRESEFVALMSQAAEAANQAGSVVEALEACIALICSSLGWQIGHVTLRSDQGDRDLEETGIWHLSDPDRFEPFRLTESHSPSGPECGLARGVLESARPFWATLGSSVSGLRCEERARVAGIAAGLGIPVLVGEEVAAVLEFYTESETSPDQRTLDVMCQIASQIGRVIERQRAETRIATLAFYDSLTGLPNRQQFRDRIEQSLCSAQRYGRMMSLLFLDLDRFKQVNDNLGHTVGDQLLREVARRLIQSVRLSDHVSRPQTPDLQASISRLGGDEFTVLLSEIRGVEDAARVAKRLLKSLGETIRVNGQEVFATTSIGIAVYPDDGEDAETLIRNADRAMYHAKSRGRNNYQFYTESLNDSGSRRLHLEAQLRRALERNELTIHYQPVHDTETSELTGAEALLRWDSPEAGSVSPAEFVPVAEESGLIAPIGEWVLRSACHQSRAWRDAGYRGIRMAVNLSGHQIRQSNLAEIVAGALEESGLEASDLELEITESTIMQDDQVTLDTLRELHRMGVGLALDDFGTGYSSLSYLRRFPINRVKIDRSFVREVTTCSDDAALTTAIVAMARSLRLGVVAEGVETREQADFLRLLGCHELQGYLFSPALPPEDFDRFLHREEKP